MAARMLTVIVEELVAELGLKLTLAPPGNPQARGRRAFPVLACGCRLDRQGRADGGLAAGARHPAHIPVIDRHRQTRGYHRR